ncbi:MAG: hypothetical protein ABI986_11595 [Chloroflexota bacterium]
MGVNRPYRRICRQFEYGTYTPPGGWAYIMHSKYANSPEQYIRAFLLIQKDLQLLFDYVEPSENNLNCYSYRIHELLLRACIEIEANFKAIFHENGFTKKGEMTMDDYKKIEVSHRLSSYQIIIPVWRGQGNIRTPFLTWKEDKTPSWYKAYNQTKHNRHEAFSMATFENMLDAVCGLLIVLSSQFWTHNFSPSGMAIGWDGPDDGIDSAIGSYFRIRFPTDWSDEQRYNFNWQELKKEEDPFIKFDYSKIS